jgi:hypothetical protein
VTVLGVGSGGSDYDESETPTESQTPPDASGKGHDEQAAKALQDFMDERAKGRDESDA